MKDADKAKRTRIQKEFTHWTTDTDLVSVREPAALARLPEAERDAWKKLWSDVDDLLKKLEAPVP